jgi:hypothetical protein
MRIFYNHLKKLLYFASYRTGSSVLSDICDHHSELSVISIHEAFSLLREDPQAPIYIPYRDPEIRFRSGLTVNFYRNYQEDKNNHPIPDLFKNGYDKIYKENLINLDIVLGNYVPILAGTSGGLKRRPYHLFDLHLDYTLWMPFVLLLYDYNVKLIPMAEWTAHLKPLYHKAVNNIIERERKKSNTTNHPDAELLWSVYQTVFVDRKLESHELPGRTYGFSTLRWKNWIDPEKEIYRNLNQYRDSDMLKPVMRSLLGRLIKGRVYFTDPYSPAMHGMYSTLGYIHSQKTPLSEFQYIVKNYNNIFMSINNLFLGK